MYRHFGKAILRTPLFNHSELISPGAENNFSFDQLLSNKLNDPVFMEALYWASPEVFQLALALKAGNIKDQKKRTRLLHSLKKYMIRAGSRSTPYGLFAGCRLIDIEATPAAKQTVKHPGRSRNRKIRIDIALLNDLIEQIKTNTHIWPQLRYRANSSLYRIHGAYRYLEYQLKNGQRDYQLSEMVQSRELDQIYGEARRCALSIGEILKLIGIADTGEEELDFVETLIQMQFLVSELEPEVTGADQLKQLRDQLTRIKNSKPEIKEYIRLIDHIDAVRLKFERSAIGNIPLSDIHLLKQSLLAAGITINNDILFHADLSQAGEPSVDLTDAMINTLLKASSVLSLFSPQVNTSEEQLRQFKNAFRDRYGMQEIPLTEVCDQETGIGFPAENSMGNVAYHLYTDEMKQKARPDRSYSKYKWHDFLQEKVSKLEEADHKGIVLSDQELAPFQDKTSQLANTISMLVSALPDGQLILHSVGGSTANSLFARFAYLDPEIENLAREVSAKDSVLSGDAILAEIVHLPEGRVGNVIRRIPLSHYEIPFLAKTRLKHEIRLDDLMVSTDGHELILRSKKLNRRIIPRLSCAHNYGTSQLAAYQFLCALQHQGINGLQLNWGGWASGRKFMPRVSYGKVILQLARWSFKPYDYLHILQSPEPEKALEGFIQKWKLPKFIAISDGDNTLVCNTREKDYLQILLEELRKKKPVKFVEWLHFEHQPQTPVKTCVNQFIIPLYKEDRTAINGSVQDEYNILQATMRQPVPHLFPPGSEWIYLKVYCGAHLSDKLLSGPLNELQHYLFEKGFIDLLFFVRYTDPHYHIRLRMHLKNNTAKSWGKVMRKMNDYLKDAIASRAIWKVQMDSYQREVERYGIFHINTTEELFFKDSMICLKLIREELFIDNEKLRLLTAVKSIDSWLNLFKLDHQERISFTAQMSAALCKEFGTEIKKQTDKQYRIIRQEMTLFMQNSKNEDLFELRNQPQFAALPRKNLSSYIHMSINRWFKTDQRLMEFICYSFCTKYYQMLQHSPITVPINTLSKEPCAYVFPLPQ